MEFKNGKLTGNPIRMNEQRSVTSRTTLAHVHGQHRQRVSNVVETNASVIAGGYENSLIDWTG
jgi:hypothetical protein